jgi:hypothetical protein
MFPSKTLFWTSKRVSSMQHKIGKMKPHNTSTLALPTVPIHTICLSLIWVYIHIVFLKCGQISSFLNSQIVLQLFSAAFTSRKSYKIRKGFAFSRFILNWNSQYCLISYIFFSLSFLEKKMNQKYKSLSTALVYLHNT